MEFSEYARQPDEELDLLAGALLIARDAYPTLSLEHETARVAELAAPLGRRLSKQSLEVQVAELGEYLFSELRFAANVSDYYDPRNSFVNDVLDRRLGIPVTLAVIYVTLARLAGVQAHGVSFPGHFLVRVEKAADFVVVDPVDGRPLDAEELKTRAQAALGRRVGLDAELLRRAPVRHIIARVLMNLRGIYTDRGDFQHLLLVLDRLIDLVPVMGSEVRDRGLLQAKLGAPRAAIEDLQRYVEGLPNAGDCAEVRLIIAELERQVAVCDN